MEISQIKLFARPFEISKLVKLSPLNSEIIYGTYANGFSVFNGESFTNFDISNGLANNLIWDISVDSKNNYWIALDGTGIQMYDGKEFKHYTMRDGLPSDETFSTFVDDFDNVWVGTWGGGWVAGVVVGAPALRCAGRPLDACRQQPPQHVPPSMALH